MGSIPPVVLGVGGYVDALILRMVAAQGLVHAE